jgi:hypothetical protein
VAATDGSASAYANLGFALELAGRSGEAETAYLTGIQAGSRPNPVCGVN